MWFQSLKVAKLLTKNIWDTNMKLPIIILLIIVAVIGLGIVLFKSQPTTTPSEEVISNNGVHWHPEVSIFTNHQKYTIPPNIGTMDTLHTHDSTGVIHLEKTGTVVKADTKVSLLLKTLGLGDKQLTKLVINGTDGSLSEDYEMKDKDKLEIHLQ